MPIQTTISIAGRPAADATLLAVPYTADLDPDVSGLPVPARDLLALHKAKAEPGEVVETPVARGGGVGRVLLYGIGDAGPDALRKAGAAVVRRAKGHESVSVTLPAAGPVAAFAEGALLGAYTFRIGEQRGKAVGRVEFVAADPGGVADDVRAGELVARSVAIARDLANTPASVKTPAWLAERAVEHTADQGVTVRVWSPQELREGGFGGILAVGQGSASPPRFIELSYRPEGGDDGRHVVLVGKGITFDSGGLSLKPTANMKSQKTDMAGGATVIAVLSALRRRGVRARVTGLVAAAENMPSGTAQRPSDVITQYGGRTVEVLNTDAEGRLVLADVLAYADAVLAPDAVIDVATLTGAINVALGPSHAGLYSSDEELARSLIAAGEDSGDRMWRMPLIDDYRPALESPIADLANVESGTTYGAGSITAALFLREFAGGRPWAHLDIAGTGRSVVDDGLFTKGATGFGVRALLRWLDS
ncbi:leucyl aminopeptidase [Spongiactinospora gelatinilytica]|uniref:Probable cytosol aminopeptidase n=1 Tax=Spongiactinospora gelatinilytica TaxID=2666298 RepID=A0A2W2G3M8_9ACTN|nr:leucyl aminopeptidase [Spongiactinospora gelatinilytica]PZG42643.1 leucyl aminopeptidase [Spongiactinospora gelatinilytica]